MPVSGVMDGSGVPRSCESVSTEFPKWELAYQIPRMVGAIEHPGLALMPKSGTLIPEGGTSRVNELNRYAEGACHAIERERAIGLQKLVVCENAHLPDVEA